jgi:PBP1b-binding outer membrane lipoprotein LpoB
MKIILSIVLIIFLVGCATVMGDRTVNVTENQIQDKLNEKLSIPISLLKVFDLNLSNSLVSFDQNSGRMLTTMDTNLSSGLFNNKLSGKLGISGKLRFDVDTNSVVLDDTQVEQFSFDGASENYNDLLNALAKTVGGELLNGLTLYKVNPEDLKVAGTQYVPKDMVVTDKGLQLTLTPQ